MPQQENGGVLMFQLVRENKSADLHRLLDGNKEIDINVLESFACDWTANQETQGKEVGRGTGKRFA